MHKLINRYRTPGPDRRVLHPVLHHTRGSQNEISTLEMKEEECEGGAGWSRGGAEKPSRTMKVYGAEHKSNK